MAVAIIESRTLKILDYWSSGSICLVFKSSQVNSQVWIKTIINVSIKHNQSLEGVSTENFWKFMHLKYTSGNV